jgi:hypothetical protein
VTEPLAQRRPARCNGRVGETCSICGAIADPVADGDPPVAWSADMAESRDGPRIRWVCAACTRLHVREIEAKLDQNWW